MIYIYAKTLSVLLGFMRNKANDVPRVTVLTHCEISTPDRLLSTAAKSLIHSSMVCAVDGRIDSNDKDLERFRTTSLHTGVETLRSHLEERITDHISTQYPKAISELQKSLAKAEKELGELVPLNPIDIVSKCFAVVKEYFASRRSKLHSSIRVDLEEVKMRIRGFRLGRILFNAQQQVNSFDVLERGEEILYQVNNRWVSGVVVKESIGKATIELSDKKVVSGVKHSDMYFENVSSFDGIVVDIKAMIEQRGLRNDILADRQPIVAEYAKQFAVHYKEILLDAVDDIHRKLLEDLRDIVKFST